MIIIKLLVFYCAMGFLAYIISKPFIHKKQTRFSQAIFYTIGWFWRPIIILAVSIETWELERRAYKTMKKLNINFEKLVEGIETKNNTKLTNEERVALLEVINKIR